MRAAEVQKRTADEEEKAVLEAIRRLLPTRFPTTLNAPYTSCVRGFDLLNSSHQYEETVVELARVACLHDLRGSLDLLLQHGCELLDQPVGTVESIRSRHSSAAS